MTLAPLRVSRGAGVESGRKNEVDCDARVHEGRETVPPPRKLLSSALSRQFEKGLSDGVVQRLCENRDCAG